MCKNYAPKNQQGNGLTALSCLELLLISHKSFYNHYIPPKPVLAGTFRTLDQNSGWVAVLKNLIFKPWLPQLLEAKVPPLNICSVKVNFLLSALHLPAFHRLVNSLMQEDLSQLVPGTPLKVTWGGILRSEKDLTSCRTWRIFGLTLLESKFFSRTSEFSLFHCERKYKIQGTRADLTLCVSLVRKVGAVVYPELLQWLFIYFKL